MRTTLTLDEDVAKRLQRLAKKGSFKHVVNEALRAGLHVLESDSGEGPFEMQPTSGQPRFANMDNVADVLAAIEGDAWR